MIMTKDSHGNYVKIEDIKQQDSFNGISPIDFKSNGDNLKNYRIYGNTVNGESVGDKTANLFDESKITSEIIIDSDGSASPNNNWRCSDYIDVLSMSTISILWESDSPYFQAKLAFYGSGKEFISVRNIGKNNTYSATAEIPNGSAFMRFSYSIVVTGQPANRRKIQIVEGSISTIPYEPYGYRVPVTVTNGTDTETTNIYLPEPIKMVGDDAEYIDYAEQKQHRVRKNLLENTATSQTINGLTLTVNTDGSVTCNGRREQTTTFFTIANVTASGEIILSGCPSGGSSTSFAMRAYSATISNPRVYYDIGDGCRLTAPDTYNIDIRIQSNYACDNLTFYPMIRKADIEDDTYEPHIENTDLDVTIPTLPTLSGTNTLSVNTNIKPSKVWGGLNDPRDILYVKDKLGNILFSKYYEIEDEPPLTYKAKKAGALKDYRIYGNTVDGESVGDLVISGEHAGEYKVPVTVEGKNILPMLTTPISTDVDDFHCEYDGAGTITLTTDKDNAVLNNFSIPLSEDFIIPVSIGQGGDGCAQFNNSISTSLNSNADHIWVNFYYNSTFIDSWGLTTINRRNSTYSSMGGKTINRVIIDIKGAGFSTNRKIVIRPAFILNTTEQVSFEPYHAPVTTPIYLPEQIKMVGEEAEYVDYAEQKLHRIGADDINVILPALPTLSGTNTLSVETEVQPSDIYLKGKIEKKPKIYYKIYYYSQDGQTLLYTESVLKGSNGMYSGTPTKMADPQYTYTFAGWSSSTGQTAATPEVRNNIQNDKNVYAAFSQTLNTYTVYFYNESDTPIETVQNVPYGGTATYTGATPTKQGYSFTGWSPLPTNITADTSCYAQFKAPYITDSWEVISQRSAAGTAQNYYSVGDCKPVYLNGTMGTLALDTTLYVYILGFNHNSALEGNGISFGCFKTAATNGIDVCLVDSKYDSSDTSGTKYFNMSHRGNYNYGGWKGSDMRYDILGSTDVQPSGYGSTPKTSKVGYDASSTCATNPVANTLMSCLPSDLRAVMKPVKKYTDNKGNKSNISTNVTFSIDYLPLLSEFEVLDIRIYANQYEQNKQAQYAYYNAGNSKVKYQHSSASSAANWWFRSACYDSSSDFCYYISPIGEYVNSAHKASGVAPCFLV